MKDEEKALQLAGLKETPDEEERYYNPFNCKIYDKCLEMAKWKEQEILKKLENILKGIYLPYYANNSHIDADNDELIKDIKKAILEEKEDDNL